MPLPSLLFSLLLLLAMTVQTLTASLLLCLLALLSLLGRAPLARLRSRVSLPVLGLLAFALMQGLAAVYSPFDESALAEFCKFLAAVSLAVILLARYDREDVPGLLWGVSSVSAFISLISADMSASQALFALFNRLTSALGSGFSSALANAGGTRVNGLYNDANVSAAIFSLAAFAALHLLRTAAFLHTGHYSFTADGQQVTYLLPRSLTGGTVLSGDVDGDPQLLVFSQARLQRYHNKQHHPL